MCWWVHHRFRNAIDAVYWHWTRKHVALNTSTTAPRPEQTVWYNTGKNSARGTPHYCTVAEKRTCRQPWWLPGLTCGSQMPHMVREETIRPRDQYISIFSSSIVYIAGEMFVLAHIVTLRIQTDRVGDSASFWESWDFNPEISLLTYLLHEAKSFLWS